MKLKTWPAALMLGGLLLLGCSSTPPAEVVQSYMEALSAFDVKGMAAQACPELSQELMDSSDQVSLAKDSGMTIHVDGLSYETVAENDEAAVVRIVGTVAWAGVNEEVDEDLTLSMVEGQWKLCEGFR